MGMFIEVRIEPSNCQAARGCDLCVRLCPVEVFRLEGGQVSPIYDNEDECTLCNLCVDQCPARAVAVVKLY